MRFVVTLMVRDEVDIIAAMVEHTLAQGPDMFIVTDNGSIDGTTEVLQAYADRGLVELHHDPLHNKQQYRLVTQMARCARTEYAADWVVNADADEFWVPVDKSLTLRDALSAMPRTLNAFDVPVINMVGRPARRGSGIDRLLWRDLRTNQQLNEVGIFAQPTSDAMHRGAPDIEVTQGNHKTSVPTDGSPDPAVALEVLHLPWRSFAQLEKKVSNTGRAYEASPNLRPSPNHHGMRDYKRFLAGRLLPSYLLRQPSAADLAEGSSAGWFVPEPWLRTHLHGLLEDAVLPEQLAPLLEASGDEIFDEETVETLSALGRQFHELEVERDAALEDLRTTRATAARLAKERDEARAALRAHAPAPIDREVRRLAGRVAGGARRRLGRR